MLILQVIAKGPMCACYQFAIALFHNNKYVNHFRDSTDLKIKYFDAITIDILLLYFNTPQINNKTSDNHLQSVTKDYD